MEAKVIKTGEIIDVIPFNYINDTPIYSDGNGRTFSGKEIILDGQKSIIELWIARDKDDLLFLYDNMPFKEDEEFKTYGNYYTIDSKLFPEVTWENSPRKVKIELE